MSSSTEFILNKIIKGCEQEKINNICYRCIEFKYEFKTIQKFEKIKVRVELKTTFSPEKKYRFDYQIYAKAIHNVDSELSLYTSSTFSSPELDSSSISIVLSNLHDALSKLKLNKLHGHLEIEKLNEGFNGYIESDICSVCHEDTTTKTDCKHSLCIECWSVLNRQKSNFPCPICRKKYLIIYNEFETDSDESDSER